MAEKRQRDRGLMRDRPAVVLLGWLARGAGHLVAVSVLYGTILWLMLRGVPEADLYRSVIATDFWSANGAALLAQVAVAAMIWGGVVMLWRRRGRVRSQQVRLAMARSRGTAVTEFLIILPVFCMLLFGLAQLTLNSMAGMLTSVAAFQAGRTAWLWEPEARLQRMDYNGGDINERVRLAAASVLVPTAPSSYRQECLQGGTSALFEAKYQAMRDVFAAPSSPAAYMSASQALAAAGAKARGVSKFKFMNKALDTESFSMRSALKFAQAYCSTQTNWSGVGNDPVRVTVTYRHLQTMPLVGRFFAMGEARIYSGYYNTYERAYSLPSQVDPNFTPPSNILALIASNNPLSNVLGLP